MTTLLVQNGTLSVGDVIIAGTAYGRIKAMFNFQGKKTKTTGPSTPVSVMGLNEVPRAGDLFTIIGSEKDARDIVKERQIAAEEQRFALVNCGSSSKLMFRVHLNPSLHLLRNLEWEKSV